MIAMPATSNRLQAIEQDANREHGGALGSLSDLHRVMTLAGLRHSGLLYVPLYIPLQFVLLWDFHVLAALERWQARNGPQVRKWFDALGQFEALASLASVRRDHPTWAFPEIDPDADRLSARDLGHPLLPDDSRITNDVDVGPAGTLLLVTGSNMSGKSTLLRAIGVNVALAQAGAPVCASRFTLPPLAVTTSMRIRDSLEEGTSFYMAELKRLKQIVDLAREYENRPERRLLYLLDEILLGTNSRERHIAVIRVLAHLLARGAIGAVSTHDLELATSQPLAGNCETVHFRETITAGRMTFDYRMRSASPRRATPSGCSNWSASAKRPERPSPRSPRRLLVPGYLCSGNAACTSRRHWLSLACNRAAISGRSAARSRLSDKSFCKS